MTSTAPTPPPPTPPPTLEVAREEALVGLIYETFTGNKCKHIDYEKVARYAVTLQTDAAVCKALGLRCVATADVWTPDEDWITQKCIAIKEAYDAAPSAADTAPAVTAPAVKTEKAAATGKPPRPASPKSPSKKTPAARKSSPVGRRPVATAA